MAQVEFRTGVEEVPDHVAILITQAGVDSRVLTKDEAIDAANKGMEKRVIERGFDQVMAMSRGSFR